MVAPAVIGAAVEGYQAYKSIETAVGTAKKVSDGAQKAMDGAKSLMERGQEGDQPGKEVDLGQSFDSLNPVESSQLSPGGTENDLNFFENVLQKISGEEPESPGTSPTGPANPTQGGMAGPGS